MKLSCATVALFVLLVADRSAAEAACTIQAASNSAFGPATSFVVRDVALEGSTTNAGLVCSGAILSVLGTGDHVYATIVSANGGLLGPGGDVVPYSVYGDSTTSYPIPWGVTYDYASGQLLNLLGLFGGPATALPLFFRTAAGANVAAGVYTDTITIDWSWDYCTGIGIFGICLGRDTGSGQSTFTVTLTVTDTCAVTSTPDVAFGQAPLPSVFPEITQSIGVVCTKGLAGYTVGIDAGQHPSGGARRMAGNGHYLVYELLKDDGQSTWGQTGGGRVSPPGPADGITPQLLPYRARVNPLQPAPPPGTYQDVLIVDVTF